MDQCVVLCLVTTKSSALEDPGTLRARSAEAAHLVSILSAVRQPFASLCVLRVP